MVILFSIYGLCMSLSKSDVYSFNHFLNKKTFKTSDPWSLCVQDDMGSGVPDDFLEEAKADGGLCFLVRRHGALRCARQSRMDMWCFWTMPSKRCLGLA